ncbi:MAG: CPBP family intramembrane metalloprotease [Propionibacteriaceae bacterium]|jgi:membrane protease YdiL (CAAX protease family)|nr:CPBP family intramembrane metalloprotease [Propionibacteriaceae bacterium]
MAVSLGQSAVYSILSLLNKLTLNVDLNQQTTSMNSSVTPDRPWLDLLYQLSYIAFPLVPAFLALYLLRISGQRETIGFDLKRPGFDLAWGCGLLAAIGIPGLGLLALAKALNLNTHIAPANLAAHWWTIPVLVGLAVMNGVLEEVVMLGYFFTRAKQLGWHLAVIVIASAAIRGCYHLYQGWGSGFGNFCMGLLCGLVFIKTKRVMPLVVAHTLLDVFSFVGYSLLEPWLTWI